MFDVGSSMFVDIQEQQGVMHGQYCLRNATGQMGVDAGTACMPCHTETRNPGLEAEGKVVGKGSVGAVRCRQLVEGAPDAKTYRHHQASGSQRRAASQPQLDGHYTLAPFAILASGRPHASTARLCPAL
jgi:hypothetical protein